MGGCPSHRCDSDCGKSLLETSGPVHATITKVSDFYGMDAKGTSVLMTIHCDTCHQEMVGRSVAKESQERFADIVRKILSYKTDTWPKIETLKWVPRVKEPEIVSGSLTSVIERCKEKYHTIAMSRCVCGSVGRDYPFTVNTDVWNIETTASHELVQKAIQEFL